MATLVAPATVVRAPVTRTKAAMVTPVTVVRIPATKTVAVVVPATAAHRLVAITPVVVAKAVPKMVAVATKAGVRRPRLGMAR